MATMATMAIVERIAWLEQMHVREPERGWNRLAQEWHERYERQEQEQCEQRVESASPSDHGTKHGPSQDSNQNP